MRSTIQTISFVALAFVLAFTMLFGVPTAGAAPKAGTVTLSACTKAGASQTCTMTRPDGSTASIQWMSVARGSVALKNGTFALVREPSWTQYGQLTIGGAAAYFA
jgi:protein-S-isoprenylcysteine O-methyltransferase Ste14